MGTVSRLPEKIRMNAPIMVSEAEAFDGVHALIRKLSTANDGFAADGNASSMVPALANSGLLGITVPSEQGGADVSNIVLSDIILSVASADRMVAAALASHFHSIELLRGTAAAGVSDYFCGRALAGDLFLMAGVTDDGTEGDFCVAPETGRPGWRLNGQVESAIDPIHADWIVIGISDAGGAHAVFVPRITAGLRLTPEQVNFTNVHVDADCFVTLADHAVSTAAPLDNLLQSAQKLGWAERKLNDRVASHARLSMRSDVPATDDLSSLGLTVSRIESGKATLERAGRRIDTAQVNVDADAVEKAAFAAAIALSSAAEALDLACAIETDHQPMMSWRRLDPYGHATIGARLLENSVH
jgi:alkylation response protein AidB-like acyl-CoA dehydrogenase